MFKQLSLRKKLILTGLVCAALPLAAVSGIAYWQGRQMAAKGSAISRSLTFDSLDQIVTGLNSMALTQHELLQEHVAGALNVVDEELKRAGAVRLAAEEPVTWTAVNQFNQQTTTVQLPRLMIGTAWAGRNDDFNVAAPVVDRTKAFLGGTATIFQRMNAGGDMIRVVTNVPTAEKKRAIGTFIPAVNPDGQPNPVIAAVMQGKRYLGRAFVVDAWYVTAYEPLLDEKKEIIGMIYAGVPQRRAPSVHQIIQATKVGQTGYPYVLDSKGHYIISQGGKRNGENIWDTKDADGRPVIQDIVRTALSLKPGEIGEAHYLWKNPDDPAPRGKTARFVYFAPWDWIIAAGAYDDDLLAQVHEVEAVGKAATMYIMAGAAGGLVLALVLFVFLSGTISRPILKGIQFAQTVASGDFTQKIEVTSRDEIGQLGESMNAMVEKLGDTLRSLKQHTGTLAGASTELSGTATLLSSGAEKTTSRSASVASASEEMSTNMETMAAGSEEMSANVKTVAAAVEQMTVSITEVARNAEQAAVVAGDAARLAESSNERISQLGTAADEIGKVIEVIQDIAEQTNLLALNATIEAARAGEAGKGFAVVATEVKELARQTGSATEDIRKRIESIQGSTRDTVEAIGEIGKVIKQVNEVSRTIASAVEEQSITTKEIARNVSQTATAAETVASGVTQSAAAAREITVNIAGVDQAARQAADGASQTQAAGDTLYHVAEQLTQLVGRFNLQAGFDPAPVKAAHDGWKRKLTEALAGRLTLDPAQVTDHHGCAFGKWYDSEGTEKYGRCEIFRQVGERHERVHALAREIARLIHAGEKADAASRFHEFKERSQELFAALDQLAQEVN